jgi:hypothetical protein
MTQEKSGNVGAHISMSLEERKKDVSEANVPDLKVLSISCPHCKVALNEEEIRSILGQFARSKRLSSLGASRFAKMTLQERSAERQRAATARWAKREVHES